MKIRWITPLLGTAPAMEVIDNPDIVLIDVRDLVDKAGNTEETVKDKIVRGAESMVSGKKTVIACDYGISRSNAIAAGILARFEGIPLKQALKQVMVATGETEIKLEPLSVVRRALGENRAAVPAGRRSVLITGGTGFLGVPITGQLEKEFKVTAPKRSELELMQGSTLLDLIAEESGADCIVHCANPRVYTSNLAIGNTLTMLRNVLDVCVTRNLRLIYLSGWEIYSGYPSDSLRADEYLPPLPKGPYGETKYLCEMLIEHSRKTRGLQCTILRSSPVYGVGGDKPKFIYNFINKISRSEQIVTHKYRNGRPALDLLYIDDLVAAVVSVVRTDSSCDFNLGTGCLTTTRGIAEILLELLNGKSELTELPLNADIANISMDSAKAKAVLGWKANVSLKQGLQKIIAIH